MALDIESESVRTYLTLLQGVIGRMAANSAACKTWCATLVSAVLVLVMDKSKPRATFVGLVPVVLFLLLDTYYLSLERDFREIHESFTDKLHKGKAQVADVYVLKPPVGLWRRVGIMCLSTVSPAVIPFYGALVAALLLARYLFPQ
jgi:hypothetical protein